jgi:predicted nucleic acid-binding protein
MLYSARNIQERARMKEQLEASLDRVDTPEDIWEQAAEIQEALTEQPQHRPASIPGLIVAATARARGLEILHYDRDFDTIARFTEQPTRWTHRDLLGSSALVRGSPFDSVRPSRTSRT